MVRSTRNKLKVGIFVSAMVGGMRDGALRWTDLREMAQRSEALGIRLVLDSGPFDLSPR